MNRASYRALSLLMALLASAVAAPAAAGDGWYRDGARRVDFVRQAPVTAVAGGAPRPVALRVSGRDVAAGVDGTAVVELEPGAETDLGALGLRSVRPLMPSIGIHLVEDADGVDDGLAIAERLRDAASRGVREAVPNLYLREKTKGMPFEPDDPQFPGQWFFANLKMPDAWGMTLGDAKTTIVIVDTGCDITHPDLVDKLDPGKDVVDNDDDPSPDPSMSGSEHGTACAGLAAASTNNGVGVAGACPACRLRCVRMLTDVAVPISVNIAAFDFAFQVDAAVVSNSWGFTDPTPVPQPLADAIEHVFDAGRHGKGAVVVFAMGNDSREVMADELEAVRGVLGIGAINNFDDQAPFTNTGDFVDLVSPTGTLTTDIQGPGGADPSDYTSLFGGTSSACPIAAGIAGLVASAAPDMTSQEIEDLLIQTARPDSLATPDANGHDPVFGYGIIDPVAALEVVLGGGAGGAGGGSGGGGGAKESDSGGCSCEAAGSAMASPWALSTACALALYVARRRRRRVVRAASAKSATARLPVQGPSSPTT